MGKPLPPRTIGIGTSQSDNNTQGNSGKTEAGHDHGEPTLTEKATKGAATKGEKGTAKTREHEKEADQSPRPAATPGARETPNMTANKGGTETGYASAATTNTVGKQTATAGTQEAIGTIK